MAAGYYSNGVNHWYIASPGSGLLSAQTTCPAPTPTPTPSISISNTPSISVTPASSPTPTPTATPAIYSFIVRLGSDTFDICSEGVTTVWSSDSSIVTGTILYNASNLVTPVTTYTYFQDTVSNIIWSLDSSDGTVIDNTGFTC